MKGCLDTERLVALGAAVDWEVEELLDHLLRCSECRQELGRLAQVQGALDAQEPAPPQLLNAVMDDLTARKARSTSIERTLTHGLIGLLAGATTMFSVALVASGTLSVGFGPVSGAAVVVALATVWWSGRAEGVPRKA